MCQGKMPETVLQRYLKLKEGNHAPDNINLLVLLEAAQTNK